VTKDFAKCRESGCTASQAEQSGWSDGFAVAPISLYACTNCAAVVVITIFLRVSRSQNLKVWFLLCKVAETTKSMPIRVK